MNAIKRLLLERYDEYGNYTGVYLVIGTLGDIDDYLSERWSSIGDEFDVLSREDATDEDICRLNESGYKVLFEYYASCC